jgi:hypothetical protein
MISMWGREINSAEAVDGCVIFKAAIMVRKRWMRWRGEKEGRGVPAEEAGRGEGSPAEGKASSATQLHLHSFSEKDHHCRDVVSVITPSGEKSRAVGRRKSAAGAISVRNQP